MSNPRDIESVRDEALRKLGRNLLNFSKVEGGFKYFLALSQFRGNPKQIRQQLQQSHKRLSKQTLGTLVEKFNRDVLINEIQDRPPSNLENPDISWSYKITYDNPDFIKEQRRALRKVVAERNKLIHRDLAFLDTTSVVEYTNLINLLDEQNPRLLAHLEELRFNFQSFDECLRELFKELRVQVGTTSRSNAQEN